MRSHPFALLTAVVLLPALLPPAWAAESTGPRGDERTLHAAGLPTDDAGLLDFFQRRTDPAVPAQRLAALVRDLGDSAADKRDRTAAELIGLGPVALPVLRQAAQDPDDRPRVGRVRQCLRLLEADLAPALPIAAARLLAHRRPTGAAAALLAYLPFADDDTVLEEVRIALGGLAVRDGRPEPALLQALADPLALRRATAAEVLGRAGGPEARPHLRRLLQDPLPVVRLAAALTLAEDARDAEALPVLLALLTDAAAAEARRAEDYLQSLAADQAPTVPLRDDIASRRKCRDAWEAWWRGTDKPGLLDDVRRRTLTDDVRARAAVLVRQLSAESFATREKATKELQAMGSSVALFLRQYADDPDGEVRARVNRVVAMAKASATPLSPLVVRVAALRKPAGAADALLDFLPMIDDDDLVGEVQQALAALAVCDGRVEPALVKGLDAAVPRLRAVAGAALWQAGAVGERSAVRKLLADRDPSVRLRVARAVAATREREAVPVLIGLVAELPGGPATEVDEYLQQVAGERAPEARPGADEESRRKCRDAWLAWWRANAADVDLPGPDVRTALLGYTLVVFQGPLRVVEIGPDLKQRWEVDNIGYSYDAQALPGNRVLIAEWGMSRVSERTTRGEVVWQKQSSMPINCQRLSNGHTVIGGRTGIVEVDRAGNEVLSVQRPQGDLMAARRARDGSVYWVTTGNLCQHLDATGKELKSFAVGQVGMGGLDLLPGGHVLVALYNDYRVVEYDAEGKVVWSAAVPAPTSAQRLPNGHTLVASQGNQQVLELDRAGKTVWEFRNGQFPWCARRR
jgi:HEAT repeat protein